MPLIQGLVEPDVSQDDVDKKRVVLKLKEMELIMETQVGEYLRRCLKLVAGYWFQ